MASSALISVLSNVPQPAATPDPVSGVALLQLAAALERLSAERRLILSLHFHEELNFEEIASILGMRRSVVECLHVMAMAELSLAEISDTQAEWAF